MNSDPDRSKSRRKRRTGGALKRGMHQDFRSFLTFGLIGTTVLAIFVVFYCILLLSLVPLLKTDYMKDAMQDAPKPVVEVVEAASKIRSKWHNLRKVAGVSDQTLLEDAAREFQGRKNSQEHLH